MAQKNEIPTALVIDVLSGEMQDRYAELGHLQIHPNYANVRELSFYASPKQTRTAVQAAYLLRWAGLNGRAIDSMAMDEAVPELVDIKGSEVPYNAIDPEGTLALLGTMNCVEISKGRVMPSGQLRKVFIQFPIQVFTVLPPNGFFAGHIGNGIRAHQLYNTGGYDSDARIPLGRTANTSRAVARRKKFHAVKD